MLSFPHGPLLSLIFFSSSSSSSSYVSLSSSLSSSASPLRPHYSILSFLHVAVFSNFDFPFHHSFRLIFILLSLPFLIASLSSVRFGQILAKSS